MAGAESLSGLSDALAVEAVLYALRMHESGNDYRRLANSFNPPAGETVMGPDGRVRSHRNGAATSTASGAYMYLVGTWNRTGGVKYAFQAPPAVQDARARSDVLARWRAPAYKRSWERVILGHFFPAAAVWSDTSRWGRERPPGPGNPTFAAYLSRVLTYLPRGVQVAQAAAVQQPGGGTLAAGGGAATPQNFPAAASLSAALARMGYGGAGGSLYGVPAQPAAAATLSATSTPAAWLAAVRTAFASLYGGGLIR